MERVRINRPPLRNTEGGGNYFAAPKEHRDFIPSGSKLLDLALGGGWAEGRVSNIVGDKSTGKTLLCIEACSNFVLKYPNEGQIYYREAEHAFDKLYAEALGMPVERVDFGEDPLETVEDMFEDIEKILNRTSIVEPVLYIVDSLDALSDRAELGRKIDEGTYGMGKAKQMSALFRRLIGPMEQSLFTLIIVSQVRDNVGVIIGRKTTRSGGRALDFFASQVVFLQNMETLTKTVSGITRPIAVRVKAKIDKNKIAMTGREAEFGIRFGYGIDDEKACRKFLKTVGDPAPEDASLRRVHRMTERNWYRIEKEMLPKQKKYDFTKEDYDHA